jgi:hypothetical protein
MNINNKIPHTMHMHKGNKIDCKGFWKKWKMIKWTFSFDGQENLTSARDHQPLAHSPVHLIIEFIILNKG